MSRTQPRPDPSYRLDGGAFVYDHGDGGAPVRYAGDAALLYDANGGIVQAWGTPEAVEARLARMEAALAAGPALPGGHGIEPAVMRFSPSEEAVELLNRFIGASGSLGRYLRRQGSINQDDGPAPSGP